MIDDEDGWPNSVDDRFLLADETGVRGSEPQSNIPLLPTIHVIRAISQLIKGLRAATLSPSVLQSFDSLFGDCVAAFPAHHHMRSDGYLVPCSLPPLLYLQNARLMLHRHNLTVDSPPEARSLAIDHCVIVAQDTARLLFRSMQDPPETSQQPLGHHDKWEARLALTASAFLCTHIWRCTLFLSFRGVYDAALLCARASAVVGDVRPVNTSCGQYLEFFLRRLTSKLQHGEGAHFDTDEEMIAYVSADLQGSIEASWVWQGAEDDIRLPERFKRPVSTDPGKARDGPREVMTQEEDDDWAGWGRVLEILEQLARGQQQEQQHLATQRFPPRTRQDQTRQAPSTRNPSSSQDSPVSSSRISIASII